MASRARRYRLRPCRLASKLAALSAPGRWSLPRAVLLFPAARVGLRTFGYGRLLRLVERLAAARPAGAAAGDALAAARQITAAVELVARRYPLLQVSCLERSLVLHSLLRRSGLPSAICLGVQKAAPPAGNGPAAADGAALLAHAWVELGQVVLNDAPDVARRYGRLQPLAQGAGLHKSR